MKLSKSFVRHAPDPGVVDGPEPDRDADGSTQSPSTSETIEFTAAAAGNPHSVTGTDLGRLVEETNDETPIDTADIDQPASARAEAADEDAWNAEASTAAIAHSATGQTPTMALPAVGHDVDGRDGQAADAGNDVDDYYGVDDGIDETGGQVDEGQVRPPVVGGTTGGAGTTTVAEVIGGIDLGKLEPGAGCDVLVARSNVVSLKRAAELFGAFPDSAGRPVLVIVPDGPGKMPSAVTAWVRILKGQASSLVLVEWVPQMRMLDDPSVAVAQALDCPKPAKWARQYFELLHAARALAQYRLTAEWDPATDIAY